MSLRAIPGSRFLAATLALGVLAACSGTILGISTGDLFGGNGAILVVTDVGADLEFDCAAGNIEEPFRLAEDGSFDLSGTYTFGVGLPVREDDPPRAEAARYTGTLRGDLLTLHVEPLERGTVIGPYELRRGEEAVIRRCL